MWMNLTWIRIDISNWHFFRSLYKNGTKSYENGDSLGKDKNDKNILGLPKFGMGSKGKALRGGGDGKESKHFQSLQIFTSHAEPCLDEFMTRREQIEMENKHREEEDKLYRSVNDITWMLNCPSPIAFIIDNDIIEVSKNIFRGHERSSMLASKCNISFANFYKYFLWHWKVSLEKFY